MNVGDRLGDWILETRIGEGSMGEVWIAHNAVSERVKGAVKVLKPNPFDAPRERFVREIESLARLKHPAVVQVLGWGEDATHNVLFLAMEHLEGESVGHRLPRGKIEPKECLHIFGHLAAGLRHAHNEGIAHRDLKPANLMLCDDGVPRIIDFGIALDEDRSRLTAVGSITGTGPYLPPEAFEEEDYDPKLGDIYALGVVLYEALTGERAFPSDRSVGAKERVLKLMGEKAAGPLDIGAEYPHALRKLVERSTEPNPRRRLGSADAFAQGIEAARGGSAGIGGPLSGTPVYDDGDDHADDLVKTLGLAVALGAGLALVGAILLFMFVGSTMVPSAPDDDPELQADTEILEEPAGSGDAAAPAPAAPKKPGAAKPAAPTVPVVLNGPRTIIVPDPNAPPEPEATPVPVITAPTTAPAADAPVDVNAVAITFASDTPGATVFINGKAIGTAPIKGHALSPGKYTLRYEAGGVSAELAIKAKRGGNMRYIWRGNATIEGFR